MLKASFYVLLATIFSVTFVGPTRADTAEGAATARQGVVMCGGSNHLRLSGTEEHATRYVLRNFDSTNPIIIERMRFFDASGAILFDSDVLGLLPESFNRILGPANKTLGPDQSAHFQSENILPFLLPDKRPIQLEIEWSSGRAALTLDVSFTRVTRRRDLAGNVFEERGRSDRDCRSIFLKK